MRTEGTQDKNLEAVRIERKRKSSVRSLRLDLREIKGSKDEHRTIRREESEVVEAGE